MYKQWLYLMTKWTTVGLNGDEFKTWDHLSSKLNKHCQECEEGEICESCRNTGLSLTPGEQFIYRNIEIELDKHRSTVVQ